MEWINKFEPLLVKPVESNDVVVNEYKHNSWIISADNQEYLIIKRKFINSFDDIDNKKVNFENVQCEVKRISECNEKFFNINYGTKDDIIIDMNGIDNFRFAESLVFNDSTVRKIMLKMNLIKSDEEYLRIGVSGARPNNNHPGGEVLEYSILNGNDGSGLSQSISGFLPPNECYSESITLHDVDGTSLREERIVYLHSALLKKCDIQNSNSIYVNIKSLNDNESLLDILSELSSELNVSSYAMQILVNNNTTKYGTNVKGRVLKHMPEKPFSILQEATDIAYEKIFSLEDTDLMYAIGTKYDRYEPEWEKFTNGRKYEVRGHIHATILKERKSKNKQHKVFHLRDVFISPDSNVQVVMTPIDTIYRIYPIYCSGNKYFCKASKRCVDDVLADLNLM